MMEESISKAVIHIQGHDILTAAANGDIERVRDHVIADPALVHVTDDSDGETGRTALIWSSIFGHMEVCKLLVECKADVMARDNENTTALHLTSCKGHVEVCKFLVECKADVNATDDSGGTPLICSCSRLGPLPRGGEGHLEVCKLLVECKADVMARTSDGAGVIEWSRDRFGHHKIAAYLLSVGAMKPYKLYKHFGEIDGDGGGDDDDDDDDDDADDDEYDEDDDDDVSSKP